MSTKNNTAWLIKATTNIHVGDENTSSYGLIDKSVQRDVVTTLPCMHASSIKGALNEYFAEEVNKDSKSLIRIFGSDKTGKKKDTQKGAYSFFDAQLLFLPVQANNRLFYMATCPGVIRAFKERLDLAKISSEEIKTLCTKEKETSYLSKPIVFTEEGTELGDFTARLKNSEALKTQIDFLKTLIGIEEDIAIFSDKDFKELCSDDNLHIIARNKLDNGESQNLWYEQMVPQKSIFYTVILGGSDDIKELENKIVQIGANATIGMGYCKFNKITEP
jgi:CRISPR-associated protein Cmr4